jgi:D-alanyl-D-alanine carboxypeptidase
MSPQTNRLGCALVVLAIGALAADCVGTPGAAPVASPTIRVAVDAQLAQLSDDNFSGVVLVAKDFVPFAAKATGDADRSRGAPNATITPFNIASITELFTAVAIGRLVDQGKVSLDDPLTKYLPTYPKATGDRITVAMLLGHTAGTGEYADDPGYLEARDSFESLSDLLAAVNTASAAGSVPGKTYKHSSVGYLLLGAVIEKASGRDYYSYLDDEVFAKAGVAAGFLPNTEKELTKRGFALGYTPDGSKNWSSLPARGTPASGAYATAPDLLSFHKALASGALVKPETVRRLVVSPPPSSTTGLTSGVFAADDVGASAVFAMTPAGYTVIVLANASGTAQPVAAKILKLIGI